MSTVWMGIRKPIWWQWSAEKRSLVVPEFSVVAQQGMILDNFSDYLVEATKEELTQIVHLMLDKVDVDFDLGRICRIEVHPEFIELFRMGLKGGQWEEKGPGLFEGRPSR